LRPTPAIAASRVVTPSDLAWRVMSGKVATFYEAEVDNAVDAMSSLLEPLIMAVLSVLVGGLVVPMYLPIFKLASVV
jgi:type IV pilus assembly protein PilC